jgi:hypothetical protein
MSKNGIKISLDCPFQSSQKSKPGKIRTSSGNIQDEESPRTLSLAVNREKAKLLSHGGQFPELQTNLMTICWKSLRYIMLTEALSCSIWTT